MNADDIAKRIKHITKESAIQNYQELKDMECLKNPTLARPGNKSLDYFFLGRRLKTKTKRNISFIDALKNKKTYKYILDKTRKIRKWDRLAKQKSADAKLADMYATFQLYYGTVSQFRPSMAKYIYCQLKPTVGILDISSGFGGRAIAAMAMGIPYYGFDTNKSLKSAYDKMIKTLQPDANVNITYIPSEKADFSKFKYDLVFTSPPYSLLEKYEHMPEYKDDQDFVTKFFIPAVKNAWTYLQNGGYMALNMPPFMYDTVKSCLPKLDKRIKMPLADRHAGEAVRGEELAKGKTQRYEYIYVWKKNKNRPFEEDAKGCGVL
jgi:hypothetical protein